MSVELAALHRILEAARARYVSLTYVGGNLQVQALTESERLALAGLLGESIRTRPGERLRMPLKRLEEALQVQGLGETLPGALAAYFGGPIRTRQDEKGEAEVAWVAFCARLAIYATGELALGWHDRIKAGTEGVVQREFRRAEAEGATSDLESALRVVLEALSRLPILTQRPLRMPVFAQQVTGDPHGFDEWRLAGRFLRRALVTLGENDQLPKGVLEWAEVFRRYGLAADGISSSVASYGICQAVRADGSVDRVVAGAAADKESLLISLRQVSSWTRLEIPNNRLYAVENPAVFEELLESVTVSGMETAMICTSGFPSAAALQVMDLAVEAGAQVRYSGDFDRRGLEILVGLLDRYGTSLVPWGMHPADYRDAILHPLTESLATEEIRVLQRIEDPIVRDLVSEMSRELKRGYQESILDRLAQQMWNDGHAAQVIAGQTGAT